MGVPLQRPHQVGGRVVVAAGLLKRRRGVEQGLGLVRPFRRQRGVGGSGLQQVAFKVKFVRPGRRLSGAGLKEGE